MRREVRLFDELDRFAGGGEITHALALTFGYDGDVAAERIFTPLIQRYGARHPVVIASGRVDEGTALGVHVLRAGRMGRVFHPKMFLAVRDGAVFLAIGSANLTRGGLGANLELVTTLVFGEGAERPPPPTVLSAALAFTERVVAKLPVAKDSQDKASEVLRAAAIVLPDLPQPRRAPSLQLVHSLEQPLWEQMVAAHGDDPVVQLVVVSPFCEADDPDAEESDSLVRHALGAGLPWAPRARPPRCLLHVGALGPATSLPRAALEELGDAVELRPQALSVEPRRLHGKALAIVGKRRTTMLWGSPNFTPSALLRAASAGGNVECGLLLTTQTSTLDAATLVQELDLGEVFHTHRGPLPEPARVPPPEDLLFEVGEALYDPEKRTLALHGETYDERVRGVRARLDGIEGARTLLEGATDVVGAFSFEGDAPDIEEEDRDTEKRRLRTLYVFAEALDAGGVVVQSLRVRLNVRFDDALEVHQNLLLGKEALSADALLVPSSAPPEQRVAALDAQIALWKAVRRGERAGGARHHASLDVFFRNVRHGLDARWRGLVARRGSRFALLGWSNDLRRSLAAAAVQTGDLARTLYLVQRVATHIERVLSALAGWHADLGPVRQVLHAARLADALDAVPLGREGARPELIESTPSTRSRVSTLLRRLDREEG